MERLWHVLLIRIIARTIGGPYAVLIAEQLKASGAEFAPGAYLGWMREPVVATTELGGRAGGDQGRRYILHRSWEIHGIER